MSEHIPKAVLTEALRRQINGRRVLAAVFCTFRFEPGFFEQEILPVLFDLPLHQVPAIRRLQLEHALRPLAGKVAVFYDPRAIAVGDGTAGLDVGRIPVRPTTGYFHPKNAFILVQDASTQERALVVLTASANLTQAGWWENVECSHIEEIAEGGRSRTGPQLQRFLRHLRTLAKSFGPQEALEDVGAFLKAIQPIVHRTANSVLHPHFLFNGRRGTTSLVDQLDEIAGEWLRGANLEVISPYLDDADASQPLADLIDRFQPRRWRVLLPEERGLAHCREALYDWVCEQGGEWGRLPGALTARGSKHAAGASASLRTVHAKVYRFFTKDWELSLVGSFNLTGPAHQMLGNVESGVLVETTAPRRPRFWLDLVEEPPPFAQTADEDEGVDQDFIPLLVRYDWATECAEVLWDGAGSSSHLEVYDQGVPIFATGPLEPATWAVLPAEDSQALRERLRLSSFLTVVDGDKRGIILVHETGLAHRPSVLLDLSPAEILRYWSLLNADQRVAYLAERGESLSSEGSEGLAVTSATRSIDTIFDRFAGMFHGFASLARAVREALEDDRVEAARFLMFGAKYDSLPVLVQRVANDIDGDVVDRYLMVLCAQQLAGQVRRDWAEFWNNEPVGVARLEDALAIRSTLRSQIATRNDPEMAEFLDWYEPRFLADTAEAPA